MTIRQFFRVLPVLAAVFGLLTAAPEALAAKAAEKKPAHASKTPAKTGSTKASTTKKASSSKKTTSKKTAAKDDDSSTSSKKTSSKKTTAKKTTTKKGSAKASDATTDGDDDTPVCKSAPAKSKSKSRGKASRKTAKTATCVAAKSTEAKNNKTADALRSQTDDFVSMINTGQQSLLDAKIAWGAKHPEVACQRAKSAKAQFAKARTTLDGMVKTAQADKADTAPLKDLYPKTDELDATTRQLISQTCTGQAGTG